MTTAEAMAVAVLKGDLTAARALAEHLTEEYATGWPVLPVHKITCSPDRIRVAVFLREGTDEAAVDWEMLRTSIRSWVSHDVDPGDALVLLRVERIELYELPEYNK